MSQDPKPGAGATSSQLAKLFDCTVRQVELYAKDKIVVRVGRGRYDAAESTRNLVRYLRQQAAGRAGVDADTDTAAANREKSLEQAMLTRARRLKLEEATVDVVAVRGVWSAIVVGTRQMFLGLPGRIAAVIPTLSPHDRKMIDTVIRDALKDASLARGFQFGPAAEAAPADDEDDDDAGDES